MKNSKVVSFLSPFKVGQAGNLWTLPRTCHEMGRMTLGGTWMWWTRFGTCKEMRWAWQEELSFSRWRGEYVVLHYQLSPHKTYPNTLSKTISFMENYILLSILLCKSLYKTYTERSDYKVTRKKLHVLHDHFIQLCKGCFFPVWTIHACPTLC